MSIDKDRINLAKMLMRLFDLWKLDTESQLTLAAQHQETTVKEVNNLVDFCNPKSSV